MKITMGFILAIWLCCFFSNCQVDQPQDRETYINTLYYRVLGLAYLEEDRLEEAEVAFSKLIELAPKEGLGYANLGLVYLRQGKYPESREQLERALKKDPDNPDIRLIWAKYHELTDNQEQSIEELKKIIELAPDQIEAYYTLAEMYALSSEQNSQSLREEYLTTLIDTAPGNIVPQLQLVELLLSTNRSDRALQYLESLEKKFPEFPKEADAFYKTALQSLHASNPEEALSAAIIFHNFMKVTAQYQSDLRDLKGPGGRLVGSAVVTLSDFFMTQVQEGESILESISFSEATSKVGLSSLSRSKKQANILEPPTHLALADYDGDGYTDLYVGTSSNSVAEGSSKLFKNRSGLSFADFTEEAGIQQAGKESAAIFADYDNNGKLDLYVVREGPNILYHNDGTGKFRDVSSEAMVDDNEPGNKPLFLDLDHEGDLDLFLLKASSNILYRNNSDGTFLDYSDNMGIAGKETQSYDAGFADFDEDGDLDLFVANAEDSNVLYSNLRHGRFAEVTEASGLESSRNSRVVEVADYNNDGFSDLFMTPAEGGKYELWRNKGDGTFEEISGKWMEKLSHIKGHDAIFIDFDNDGFLDLLVTGEPERPLDRGAFLFHNDGQGDFQDVSNVLPESFSSGWQVEASDYDKDGDLDIYLVDLKGGVRLFQNNGGNINRYLNIQVVGLRSGSGKNNHFGIGAQLEVRAGDLYQMKTISEPMVHFGLGHRLKADVVRILWTNGVPQNIFYPGSDQDLIESQVLKGSCAFLYTWNGTEYVFVKDMMWRSALGMPTGIMGGGSTAYAFPHPSKEYLKIPGEQLSLQNGLYNIRITEELWETAFFDQTEVIALDHPDSTEIFVDERFTPPPFPDLHVYPVAKKNPLRGAWDGKGNDLLSLVVEKDDLYISNFRLTDYQGISENRDLILDLGHNVQTEDLILFLNGWLFPTDASINVSISQSEAFEVISPYMQVINEKGEWETVIKDIGFPMGKDKMVILNLSG
ncbi:MAG: FG-GAP-like repeat-containing protein, partial [Saprospiraceae bacterium]|nr:FG-GAP-like repeat-containing protein [Saprospiraceae bacterium]